MKVIGSYPICNTAAILIHDINYDVDDEVLASMNGKDPQWYQIELVDDEHLGFWFGDIPVPLCEVMRV